MSWVSVDERLPSDYCYCLVSRRHYTGGELSTHYSFFTPDREVAKKTHGLYSRKNQGKNSIHFSASEFCFVITHWMPLPEPPQEVKNEQQTKTSD